MTRPTFIEVMDSDGKRSLINLAIVSSISQNRGGGATVYVDWGGAEDVDERYQQFQAVDQYVAIAGRLI